MVAIRLCFTSRIRSSCKWPGYLIFVSVMAGRVARPAAQSAPLLPAIDLRSAGHFTGDVWPADFNGDGVTDLAGATESGIAIAAGNGDGTFRALVSSGAAGDVLA